MDPRANQSSGDENCLHLNIYVEEKAFEQTEQLPVIVFLHGGAFMFGSSGEFLYGADYFMQQNVILVTLNYRVGAFGKLLYDQFNQK